MNQMNGFRLYWRYIRMNFLSGLQYKGWPLMILQTFFVVVTDPLSTLLLFSRFGSIGPWRVERILLIYALAVTCFGLAETFLRGFDYFPWKMVQNGAFDRVLLRPRTTFVQVSASFFHTTASRACSAAWPPASGACGGCRCAWGPFKFSCSFMRCLVVLFSTAAFLC